MAGKMNAVIKSSDMDQEMTAFAVAKANEGLKKFCTENVRACCCGTTCACGNELPGSHLSVRLYPTGNRVVSEAPVRGRVPAHMARVRGLQLFKFRDPRSRQVHLLLHWTERFRDFLHVMKEHPDTGL